MNKFTKRIIKSSKNLQACIVLGDAFGNLEHIVEIFESVFVISHSRPAIRRKNLIYREKLSNWEMMPHISMIFINIDHLDYIHELPQIWNRTSPPLMIGSGEFIDKKKNNFLVSHRYEIVELFKDHQIWKMKK